MSESLVTSILSLPVIGIERLRRLQVHWQVTITSRVMMLKYIICSYTIDSWQIAVLQDHNTYCICI